MLEKVFTDAEKRMDQALEGVKRELSGLRTGRASVSILDGISVDYYGSPTPLAQMCKLSTPDAGTIVAQPFDPSVIKDVEKAIKVADLGLNPSNDGKVVRIPIPPLTEERRKQLVKKVGQIVEEGKNGVRQVRREANDEVKRLEKDGKVSEDDAHRGLERVQKLTDDHVKKLDDLGKAKDKELMEF